LKYFLEKSRLEFILFTGDLFDSAFPPIETLKEIISFKIEIEDALTATTKILEELEKKDITDKIVLLKVHGTLKKGKHSDINYQEIKEFLEKKTSLLFSKKYFKT